MCIYVYTYTAALPPPLLAGLEGRIGRSGDARARVLESTLLASRLRR